MFTLLEVCLHYRDVTIFKSWAQKWGNFEFNNRISRYIIFTYFFNKYLKFVIILNESPAHTLTDKIDEYFAYFNLN